jgi:predicted secreted protein
MRLGSTPFEVMQFAAEKAQDRLREAEQLLGSCGSSEPGAWLKRMQDLFAQAEAENQRGQQAQAKITGLTGREAIYRIAAATRRYNSAQVHASQMIHMIVPPACLPVNLER